MIVTNNTISSYFLGSDPAQFLGPLATLVVADHLYLGDDDIANSINNLHTLGSVSVSSTPTGFPRSTSIVALPSAAGRADGDVLQVVNGIPVWSAPSGGGSSLGVWKTYGVDSQNSSPFPGGVEIGNGILIAKWWQPANVVADYTTDPFLIFISVNFKLGSTSVITDTIIFEGPYGIDEENLEIDNYLTQANSGNPDEFHHHIPTHAVAFDSSESQAYPGYGVTPSDATQFITMGDDPVAGARWTQSTPFVWAEDDELTVQRIYYGGFYGD